MSHTNSSTLTRRSVLKGSAAGLAAVGLTFGAAGSVAAAVSGSGSSVVTGTGLPSHALCAAHHKELSDHLSRILNASYVDERMKNRVLSTTQCPHCKVAIAPDMKSRTAFAALG